MEDKITQETVTNGASPSFARFGISFQEHLVYLLLINKKYAEEMFEILDLSFIDLDYLHYIAEEYFGYREKYKTFPSIKILRAILKDKKTIDPALYESVQKYFSNTKFNTGDDPYVLEKSIDFCRVQKIKKALFVVLDLLKRPNIEDYYPEIELAIKNALKFGSDREIGILYNNETLFGTRINGGARVTVPTGWVQLDSYLNGGIGAGEILVFIGGTGVGKSHMLINLGANAIKEGKTVIHYTLELSESLTALRYDSNIANISINEIHKHTGEVLAAIKQIKGKLIIKEFPTKAVSLTGIKNHFMKVTSILGVQPDLVIIDYADLLKYSGKPEAKKHLELENIYETMRGFAMEMHIPVVTASQIHRAAMEEDIISIEDIAESFAKAMVSDIVISIIRKTEDRVLGQGKLYIAKSRVGPDGLLFPVEIDTSKSLITLVDKSEPINAIGE